MRDKQAIAALIFVGVLLGAGVAYYWLKTPGNQPVEIIKDLRDRGGPPEDGPGLSTKDLPQATADVFHAMDGGIELSPEEIQGRNTWILWTAGNEQFWDRMSRESYGLIDFLKTIDSRKRPNRFRDIGFVNEPGMVQSNEPDEYGLYIDHREGPPPEGIDERVYGRSTGIIGFRLYPNPAFDAEAKRKWDPSRFYNDPTYYLDKKLIRPYRVGMACGLCHVAPHPLNPPSDPAAPKWENLASVIGNQYLHEGNAMCFDLKPGNFLWEMVNAQPRGTSDTSRIATDYINNPNTMNAIFDLGARLSQARSERMSQANQTIAAGAEAKVPHILKDGADSVGVPGASIRVYVNIGMYASQWTRLHNPLIGLVRQQPFEIAVARKHSVYWRATEERLPNLAAFFMKIRPMHLADAPGGKEFLTESPEVLTQGKTIFAENCARCHSSKRPPEGVDAESPRGVEWFLKSVADADFLKDNFLSDDQRHSVALIGTNSARAVATNAASGHVWDNFSSQTYKDAKAVGELRVHNVADPGKPLAYEPPWGGPGYYRTPSLISIWATAPFFHNNALGIFNGDPSVKGRMAAFDDAVRKLLWPERRLKEKSIWRTVNDSYLEVAEEYIPRVFRPLCDDGVLRIGPIPKGIPINLLANLDFEDTASVLAVCIELKATLLKIKAANLEGADALRELSKLTPRLLAASKCPDFVEDRGHEFGKELSDEDKEALIAFLKTF